MLIYCTLQMHMQQATYANELHVNVQQILSLVLIYLFIYSFVCLFIYSIYLLYEL